MSFTSNLHSCVLWIPCFPVVIIITDLSMLEEVYTRNILVAGSTFVSCLKYVCIWTCAKTCTVCWSALKAALQKMGNSIKLYTMNPKVVFRTSCDDKYPCACFCVDCNLVWQISVSSGLVSDPAVTIILAQCMFCMWGLLPSTVLYIRGWRLLAITT